MEPEPICTACGLEYSFVAHHDTNLYNYHGFRRPDIRTLTPDHRPSTRFPLLYGDGDQGDSMFDRDHDDFDPWDDYDLDAFNEPRPATQFPPLVREFDPELERLLADEPRMGPLVPQPTNCMQCGTRLDFYSARWGGQLPDPELERLLREEEEIELRTRLGAEYEAYKVQFRNEMDEKHKSNYATIYASGYETACGDYDSRLGRFVEWLFDEGRVHTLTDSSLFKIVKRIGEVSQ